MNRLREKRVVQRIRQIDISKKTGINMSKISMIENGLIDANGEEKKKLAKAVGSTVPEIWS